MARLETSATIAALAKNIEQLAALVKATEAVEPGVFQVRAALAVFRAHLEFASVLGAERGSAWAERGALALTRALAAPRVTRGEAVFDAGNTIRVEATRMLASGWDPAADARFELLVQGLGCRGRVAVLHAVAVELATRPGAAASTAAQAPPQWRDEAMRLAQSGVVRVGRSATFVARPDEDSVELFTPSVPMAATLAAAGALAAFHQVVSALPARERSLPALEVLAFHAAGDASRALGRLARLAARDRDLALLELVRHEIRRARIDQAEGFARRIRGQEKRCRAFAAIVHALALRLSVRKDLSREIAEAPPLERALLCAEIALVKGGPEPLRQALEVVRKLLFQQKNDLTVLVPSAGRASVWERALRCGLALALSGQSVLHTPLFPSPVFALLLRSRFIADEVASCFSLAPLARLSANLPASYRRIDGLLSGLHVERRAGAWCRELGRHGFSPELIASLRRPETRDAALAAGALLDADAVELTRDARSLLRSIYDLGVALSPRGPQRRRVLLNAVKASLRAAVGPEAREIVELRLSTLRHLEGAAVSDLSLRLLEALDLPRHTRLQLLELALRDRSVAVARLLWNEFARLSDGGRDAELLLELGERHGALERGILEAWKALASVGDGFDAGSFLADFVGVWTRLPRRTIGRRLLLACLQGVRAGKLPRDGRLAAEHVRDEVSRTIEAGVGSLLDSGSAEDIEWAILASEPELETAWSVPRWRGFHGRLRSQLGSVDDGQIRRLVRELRGDSLLHEKLVRGIALTDELAGPVDIGAGLHLSYLDKRRDLFAYLRLADCTPCCFSSTGPHFEQGLQTSRWVLRLYKDPLSFAFHVKRASTGERVGFVFGGFAMAPEPLLLLNGIYLRRQERKVRFAALDAIERTLARPLGCVQIGIANCHGGRGELPEAFHQGTKHVTRLRALRSADGVLETKLYDDIGDTVNQPIDLELHWKDLGASCSC